jgi:hypothetical protein
VTFRDDVPKGTWLASERGYPGTQVLIFTEPLGPTTGP